MSPLPAGTPIYLPSDAADGVLLLAEGRVKLCSNTPEGKQAILAFIEAGELFGELALLGDAERDEHAETLLASTHPRKHPLTKRGAPRRYSPRIIQ